MTVKLLLTLGTYEKSLYGIDLEIDTDSCKVTRKKVSFSIPAHIGYVKSLSSGPRFLVSGSTDETICIFDLRRRKDYGRITCHSCSVSCLQFYKQEMLMSAGDDGKIIITRCLDWEKIMSMRGHKGGVSSIAIHPSGKLALSTGKDKCIKTWNLQTGKLALKSTVPHYVDKIIWSPTGSSYAYLSERHVQIFATEGAKNILDLTPDFKVLAGTFLSDTLLAVAGEGTDICILNVRDGTSSKISTNHRPRIKDIQALEVNGYTFVASGSSDGLACLWTAQEGQLSLLSSSRVNMRITCLSLASQ